MLILVASLVFDLKQFLDTLYLNVFVSSYVSKLFSVKVSEAEQCLYAESLTWTVPSDATVQAWFSLCLIINKFVHSLFLVAKPLRFCLHTVHT